MVDGALQRTKPDGIHWILISSKNRDQWVSNSETVETGNRRFFMSSNNRATPVVSSQRFVIIYMYLDTLRLSVMQFRKLFIIIDQNFFQTLIFHRSQHRFSQGSLWISVRRVLLSFFMSRGGITSHSKSGTMGDFQWFICSVFSLKKISCKVTLQ